MEFETTELAADSSRQWLPVGVYMYGGSLTVFKYSLGPTHEQSEQAVAIRSAAESTAPTCSVIMNAARLKHIKNTAPKTHVHRIQQKVSTSDNSGTLRPTNNLIYG